LQPACQRPLLQLSPARRHQHHTRKNFTRRASALRVKRNPLMFRFRPALIRLSGTPSKARSSHTPVYQFNKFDPESMRDLSAAPAWVPSALSTPEVLKVGSPIVSNMVWDPRMVWRLRKWGAPLRLVWDRDNPEQADRPARDRGWTQTDDGNWMNQAGWEIVEYRNRYILVPPGEMLTRGYWQDSLDAAIRYYDFIVKQGRNRGL
jgi:hypothetical protein